MPIYQLADLTSDDLEKLGEDTSVPSIVVLPLGATEPHGPHLPLSTDTDIAQGHLSALMQMSFEGLNILVLPVEHIGFSHEHGDFAGMLSDDAHRLVARWCDLMGQLAQWGFRRFVLINAHGGNSALMELAIQQMRRDHDALAVATSWLRFGQPEGLFADDELAFGIHGGAIETSLMLHYCPEKVRSDKLDHFVSHAHKIAQNNRYLRAYGKVSMGWQSSDLNPGGVMGNATDASALKGAQSAEHCVTAFAALLNEVGQLDMEADQ